MGEDQISRAELLNCSTIHIWDWIILCWGIEDPINLEY